MFPLSSGCPCSNQANPYSQMGPAGPLGSMGGPMQMFGLLALVTMLMQLLESVMGNTVNGSNPMFARPGDFGGAQSGFPGGSNPLNNFLGGPTGSGGGGGGGGGGNPVAGGAFAPPTDGSTNAATQRFINAATSKQGAAYVFGEESNGRYDCSGLVYAALKESGVNGPRLTARGYQAKYKNSQVRKEDLKPGDLVFFHSKNDRGIPAGQATHIEIYLGNGMTMGTDNPKEGAKIEKINWNTFIGGARVPELNR